MVENRWSHTLVVLLPVIRVVAKMNLRDGMFRNYFAESYTRCSQREDDIICDHVGEDTSESYIWFDPVQVIRKVESG